MGQAIFFEQVFKVLCTFVLFLQIFKSLEREHMLADPKRSFVVVAVDFVLLDVELVDILLVLL